MVNPQNKVIVYCSFIQIRLFCLKQNTEFLLVKHQRNIKHLLDETESNIRLRLHEAGSTWNRFEIGTGKPCDYTEPDRSALDQFFYLLPNGFTCSDPAWNCVIPIWYRVRVNPTQSRQNRSRLDPIQMELSRTDIV